MNTSVQDFNLDKEYLQALKEQVFEIYSSGNSLSLNEIIINCHGAYPTDVRAIIKENKLPYNENVINIKSIESTYDTIISNSIDSLFADPHPADYDWRFNSKTIDELVNQLRADSVNYKNGIALLGAKTVFPLLYHHINRLTLFNKSLAILDDLRSAGYSEESLVECDLRYPIASGIYNDYSIALADPPWYLDYYQAFMARAAEILHIGGLLYLSVLPKLTRPSAASDQNEILRYGNLLGFTLIQKLPSTLSYQTPVFERNALAVQGFDEFDWRRGDLWIWRKDKAASSDFISVQTDSEPEWTEFRIGKKRIKIRQTPNALEGEFNFEPADNQQGSTLSQVSRRSSFRSRIVVWSSDNRAYYVTRPSVLERYLAAWDQSSSIFNMSQILVQQADISKNEEERVLALLRELIK